MRQALPGAIGADYRELDRYRRGYVRRGLSEDEAVAEPLDVVRSIDPYPIGQRLFPMSDNVTESNVRNVYKRVLARQSATAST